MKMTNLLHRTVCSNAISDVRTVNDGLLSGSAEIIDSKGELASYCANNVCVCVGACVRVFIAQSIKTNTYNSLFLCNLFNAFNAVLRGFLSISVARLHSTQPFILIQVINIHVVSFRSNTRSENARFYPRLPTDSAQIPNVLLRRLFLIISFKSHRLVEITSFTLLLIQH